jgi:hypothetical protein
LEIVVQRSIFDAFRFDATWKINSVSDRLKEGAEPTSMEIVNRMESPRFIKTHLPLNLLPLQIQTNQKRPKIIYVARNPKDLCVSFYHHRVLIEGYKGTVDEFVDEFVADLCKEIVHFSYELCPAHSLKNWVRRTLRVQNGCGAPRTFSHPAGCGAVRR